MRFLTGRVFAYCFGIAESKAPSDEGGFGAVQSSMERTTPKGEQQCALIVQKNGTYQRFIFFSNFFEYACFNSSAVIP